MGLSRGKRREKSNVGLGLSLERGREAGFPLNCWRVGRDGSRRAPLWVGAETRK
jgi:hypothetical protein